MSIFFLESLEKKTIGVKMVREKKFLKTRELVSYVTKNAKTLKFIIFIRTMYNLFCSEKG